MSFGAVGCIASGLLLFDGTFRDYMTLLLVGTFFLVALHQLSTVEMGTKKMSQTLTSFHQFLRSRIDCQQLAPDQQKHNKRPAAVTHVFWNS